MINYIHTVTFQNNSDAIKFDIKNNVISGSIKIIQFSLFSYEVKYDLHFYTPLPTSHRTHSFSYNNDNMDNQ